MAKYDNLLEQDLFELFGQEFLEKVIKDELGKYLTDKNREKIYSLYKINGNSGMKACLLLGIMQNYLINDKSLKEAYERQDIGRLLVVT